MLSEISPERRDETLQRLLADPQWAEFYLDDDEHVKHPLILGESNELHVHRKLIPAHIERHVLRSAGYPLSSYCKTENVEEWLKKRNEKGEAPSPKTKRSKQAK